jgi:hypothetical protein
MDEQGWEDNVVVILRIGWWLLYFLLDESKSRCVQMKHFINETIPDGKTGDIKWHTNQMR